MRSEFNGAEGFFSSSENSMRNMSKLYGLSDFWHIIFEDSDKIDTLLEANAITASDIYSQFLQLTSSITLEHIQLTVGTQIKLFLLSQENKVPGTVATYTIPEGFQEARYITNRPFLATVTYEAGPHFDINIGTNTISFYRDPFEESFPFRKNSRGYEEIAMWAVDAQMDERAAYENYGKLIGQDPEESTEKYKNFLYGLFYLYTHGPDLAMVRRGLNVALGIPLARDDETVLSIRKTTGGDQYLIVTDLNSYILPFGLVPTVAVGESISTGDELTTWVEVKDYLNDGDWWINLEIPKAILPYVPEGQIDSYAKPNSYADYLMRHYLKNHTFLVKVNVTSFKNIQSFQQLGDIIQRVKPTYTTPIYIWAVPIADEELTLEEGSLDFRRDYHFCEVIMPHIFRMRRNSGYPAYRGCPAFIRMSLGQHEVEQLGLDPYINGTPTPIAGGTAEGYVNRAHQFRANTAYENALMKVKFNRNTRNVPLHRNMMAFTRDINHAPLDGDRVDPWPQFVPLGMWTVPLYITTLDDLQDRFVSIGIPVPDGGPAFTLMQPYYADGPINEMGIDETTVIGQFELMVQYYSLVFSKGDRGSYLGSRIPDFAKTYMYRPAIVDLKDTDYLLCTQIMDRVYAVYWVTSSTLKDGRTHKSVYGHSDPDELRLANLDMPMTRGLGLAVGTPAYVTRGGVPTGLDPNVAGTTFTDTLNNNAPKTRGSVKIQVDSVLGSDFNPSA